MKALGMMLMLVGVSSLAFAISSASEDGDNSALSALALLSGALLVIRSRKK